LEGGEGKVEEGRGGERRGEEMALRLHMVAS
jgi:hypothetical protein